MLKVSLSPARLAVGARRIHYSWVIVVVASVMWMTSSSIRFATSLLVPYLEDPDYFGWSYGAIAFAFTLQWLLSGVLGPVVGWLGDRYGVRRLMVLGAVLFIVGMMLTGTMTHLWQFWLYFGVILAVAMAIFQVPLVTGVTLWFKTQLGLAMGILQALQGVGTAIAIGLFFVLFTQFGLRWTFWVPGIVGGGILLVLVRAFHNEPADIGLRPFGANENEPIRRLQNNDTAKVRTRVFLGQAQRTGTFWNLVGIHFWGCAGHNIILLFLIAMVVDQGLSQGTAVGVYITLTAVSTITRFVVPVVADRMGSKGAMGVSFALQTLPVLMLLVAQDAWVFYLFAALFGIGMGGEMVAFPIINRQYYGDAPTGTTYGWQMLGAGLGMALGPLLGGYVWDVTGEYTGAVVLSFVLSLVGVVSILVLPSTSHLQLPHWEEALPPQVRSSDRANTPLPIPRAGASSPLV
jgi:MFS family permease